MKNLALLILLVCAGNIFAVNLGGTEVPKDKFVIFILIGHSNTTYTPDPDQTAHARFFMREGTTWKPAVSPLNQPAVRQGTKCGPGMHIGKKLAALYPDYYIGIIEYGKAGGGGAIRNFYNGTTYGNAVLTMAKAAKNDGTIAAVITIFSWFESCPTCDGGKYSGDASNFVNVYKTLVQGYRDELGMPNLPFVSEKFYTNAPARLGTGDNGNIFTNWTTVRDKIETLPSNISNVALNDNQPPASTYEWDRYKMHFNRTDHVKWGERAAVIIQEKGWFPTSSSGGTVATPGISPNGGEHKGSVEVTLTTSTPSATLRYTLDGSNPTSSSTQYSSPFTLTESKTVKARAFRSGWTDSDVASASFTITADDRVATSISVTPQDGSTSPNGIIHFSAQVLDQDGDPMPDQPTFGWSVSDGGDISSEGVFTSDGSTGTFQVTASMSSPSLDGSASFTVEGEAMSITIQSPTGGEAWAAGSTQHIRWATSGVEDIMIFLSTDGGISYLEQLPEYMDDQDASWGDYELTLPDEVSGTCLIKLQNYKITATAISNQFSIVEKTISTGKVEAESGTITAPMWIVSGIPASENASGNAYIQSETNEQGSAAITFTVETSGEYKFVARSYASNSNADEFYVKVDDEEEFTWDLNPTDDSGLWSKWRESEISDNGTDPYRLNLSEGDHTITFRCKERHAVLDYFYLVQTVAVQTRFSLEKSTAHAGEMFVYDIQGRMLGRLPAGAGAGQLATLNFGGRSTGCYIIRTMGKDHVLGSKMLLVR